MSKIYDLIIVGGGPAGVSAGVYASRKKIDTLLLTQYFGGQALNSDNIENFIGYKSISGYDLSKILEEQLRNQDGIEIKDGILISQIKKEGDVFEVVVLKGESFFSRNILVTSGSRYKRLNIPGEEKFEGKGVYYCSICDAPLMKGKEVVVVGGGNSGLEAAIDLLPYAKNIYIFEYSDIFRGDTIHQEKLKREEKVKMFNKIKTLEFLGEDKLSAVKYLDMNDNQEKTLSVSGVFVEIGYDPNSLLVKDLVELNQKGQIVVDHKTLKTSCPGVWAAGDVTDGLYNQINTAIGDAIKAVLNIYENLRK